MLQNIPLKCCLLSRDNKQLTATRDAAFLEKDKTFNFVTMQLAPAGDCKRGALDFINLSLILSTLMP